MRLNNEELEKVKQKYKVNDLWSFSRFDTYRNSSYEYFLKYIKHENPNGESSPYGIIGGDCHDIIESLYDGKIKYDDMAETFDTSFVSNIDMLGLKFNRSDEEMNKSIKKKYYENLLHFFKHYKMLPYKMANEKFVTIQISDDIVMQGYIDNVYKNENEEYIITDYKTSSAYKGKAIEEHSHQLVLYAAGINQMGVPADKIRIQWNFLKYVNLTVLQKNGKYTSSTIERRDIGQKCKAKAVLWLKAEGYDDNTIEEFTNQMLVENSIECLPDTVKDKFTIEDAYVEIENWQDIWEELQKEIIITVNEINKKKSQYDATEDEKIWWDSDDKLKEQSYYLSQLSEYSIEQLKPYKDYLERQETEKAANEDLLGVTSRQDDDLSWLDELD